MKRAALLLLVAGGCRGSFGTPPYAPVETGGDPQRGEQAIVDRHCGACHAIPGIRGARGVVAAPLTQFALRTYIAGQVPNTPDNLVRWIRNPHQIDPGNAMPALGLDENEARDVAAYLYTLR
ncbi:MAG: c-type cytochrome [Deltaproteobacteria bacterium]|nr:MAG: c-type cytochrome [Deltaproteobacteria bacterium]TMB32426.1 MAG: c-type cytochrome [Deltaproteobacteria bacterium]